MPCHECLDGMNLEPCCGDDYGKPLGSSLVYPQKAPLLQTAVLAGIGYAVRQAFSGRGKNDRMLSAAGVVAAAFGTGVLWKRWSEYQRETEAFAPETPMQPWLLSGAALGAVLAAPSLMRTKKGAWNLRYGAGFVAMTAWVSYRMKQNASLAA